MTDILGWLMSALYKTMFTNFVSDLRFPLRRKPCRDDNKTVLGTFDSANTSIKMSINFKGTNLNSIALLELNSSMACFLSIKYT